MRRLLLLSLLVAVSMTSSIGGQKNVFRTMAENSIRTMAKRSAVNGCSSVPTTNSFITKVDTVVEKSEDDRECIERVEETAGKVKDNIIKFHRATAKTKEVKDYLFTMSVILTPLSNMPYIGPTCSTFKTLVNLARKPVDTAYPKMKSLDNKLYPTWSDRSEKVEDACVNASKALTIVEKYGKKISDVSTTSRDCICDMPANSNTRSESETVAEATCGRLNPIPHTMNQALGRISSVCDKYDDLCDKVLKAMPTNVLNNVINKLTAFLDFLRPVKIVFDKINLALDKRMCLPNPKEVAEETAEKVKEKAKEVKEKAEEVKEKAKKAKKKLRKKLRGKRDADIFLTKAEANDVIGSKVSRVRRASNICFTVRQIIKGLDSAFKEFTKWAQGLLNALLKQIPGLNSLLDFLPDWDFGFDVLGNINWPNVDFADLKFDWTLDKYYAFVNMGLDQLKFDIPDSMCSVAP